VTADRKLPIVLFVCVQNAGRSQMAEALFNQMAAGRALARSAGSRPADAVHQVVAESMGEIGIDLTAAKPKGLTPDVIGGVDYIVGMGCGDECPHVAGTTRFDWDIPDPSGLSAYQVRGIRNEIKRQIDLLLPQVLGEAAAG
jgi:protein-tyrosine-phosphatase